MLRTLIKKEIIETILDLRFVIAMLLCVVLIPLGMYVSVKDYQQRLQEYHTSVQQYEQRSRGRMYSGDFEAEGYRPPSPLSIFSSGLREQLKLKVTTQYDGNYRIENLSQDENSQAILFGKVDFVYIASTVLSLLALIFTFRTVTGEKESGTLRLIIAGSIPRWKVVFSKMVGNYVVFLIPFLISFLVSLLIVNSSDVISLSNSPYIGTVALLLIITLLFLLCIFGLGTLISTLTHSSIVSMIGVLFVWVLFALVIPKMSPMIAETVYPVRSKRVVDMEKAMLLAEIDKEQLKEESDLFRKVLAEAGFSEDQAFADSNEVEQTRKEYAKKKEPILRKYQERITNEIRQIENDYANKLHIQKAIATNFSRISPLCCFTYILSEISGTGSTEVKNFSQQAQQFQDMVKQNHYTHFEYSYYRLDNRWTGGTYRKPEYDPSKAPVPHMSNYCHGVFTKALNACWIDIVLLVLFSVLFFTGSFVSFLRYDVR